MAQQKQQNLSKNPYKLWIKLAIALVFAVGVFAVFLFDLAQWLSLSALQTHYAALQQFVADRPWFSASMFVALYIITVALSIPGAVFMTIAAGLLFGPWLGTILVLVGANMGAVLVFLVARYLLAEFFARHMYSSLQKFRQGFQDNAFFYLLSLRLVPLFPFWLVNLAPALLGIALGPYIVASVLGMIPGSIVYVGLGHGAGSVLAAGETLDIGIIFAPEIFLPLLGLALLSLATAIYRHWRQKHNSKNRVADPEQTLSRP